MKTKEFKEGQTIWLVIDEYSPKVLKVKYILSLAQVDSDFIKDINKHVVELPYGKERIVVDESDLFIEQIEAYQRLINRMPMRFDLEDKIAQLEKKVKKLELIARYVSRLQKNRFIKWLYERTFDLNED